MKPENGKQFLSYIRNDQLYTFTQSSNEDDLITQRER